MEPRAELRPLKNPRAKMPVLQKGAMRAARSHDQADARAGDRGLCLGASGRGEVSDKLGHGLAESDYEQSKSGNGDCEEETVGNEFITHGAPINHPTHWPRDIA